MKMIYQIKPSNSRNKFFGSSLFKKIVKLVSILFLIFILNILNFGSFFVDGIVSPFLKAGNYIYGSLAEIPRSLFSKDKISEENEILRGEVEALRLDIFDYQSIKYENQKLREVLEMGNTNDTIVAWIIARAPQVPLDTLIINKGISSLVNEGDLVRASEKVVLGKIIKVSNSNGTVVLNTFPDVTSFGLVARTAEPLEIRGAGGGSMETSVPIDLDISLGAKIISAGPDTYLLAIVGAIEEDRPSGFKKVLLSLPVNIYKVDVVFVELSTKE